MELSPSQSRSSSVSDEVSSNRDDSYEKNQNKKQSKGEDEVSSNRDDSYEKNQNKKQSKGEDEEQKVYKCKYCDKEFEHWQALGGHQNKHKEERFEAKWQKDFKRRLSAEQLERLLLFKQYEHILSGNTTRIAPLPPPPSYYSNLVAPHDSFDDYHQRRTSNELPSTSHGGGGPTTGKGMRTNPPTKEEQIMRFDQLMKQHGMKRVTIKQNGSPVSLQGMKRIPITECRVKQIPMTQIGMKQSPMIAPQQRMGENPIKRRRIEDYHHNNPNENRRVDNNGGNRGDLFSKNKNSDAHGGNRGDMFSKGKSSEDFKALGLFREVAGMEDGGICLSDEDRVVPREEVDLTLKLCV